MEPNQANISDLKPDDKKGEIILAGESTVGMIAAAEIDMQVATAHKFPRSLKQFRGEAMDMATLNETVAQECLFAITRGDKVIEGPSIRLAEIIACSWRNCRVGSRIVHEGADTVVVQGMFQDVERNVVVQSEVSRRIVGKNGRRYGLDMIVTTTNAAQAVAKRNAITSGVPRALWWDIYEAARRVAAGDAKSLATKRASAIQQFAVYGIKLDQILAKLNRAGLEEITRDDLVLLFGIFTSLRDEEVTPEEAFPANAPAPTGASKEDKARAVMDAAGAPTGPAEAKPAEEPDKVLKEDAKPAKRNIAAME